MSNQPPNQSITWELVEALGQGVVILDADGRFEYVNAAFARIAGRPAADLIGLTPEGITHPDDHPALRRARQQRIADQSSTYNTRLRRPDGAIAHVHVSGVPRRDGDRIVGAYVVITDITEQLETQAALRHSNERYREVAIALQQSETRFRTLVESSGVGIWQIDVQGRTLYINPAMCAILGLESPQSLAGRTIQEFYTPESLNRLRSQLPQIMAGPFHSADAEIVRPDGQIRRLKIYTAPMHSPQGQIQGYIGTYVDITEELRAENELRLFINHAPVAIAMFDRDMRYIAHSSRWLTDYKLDDQSLIGRSHYEVFPEIPERWRQAHRRALAGETLRADEDPFLRHDGTTQWIRWQARPWHIADLIPDDESQSASATIGGIIIYTEDITDRKQTAVQLAELQAILAQAESVAGIGSWKWDLQSEKVTWSDGMFRLFGLDREQFDGDLARIIETRIHPDDVDAVNRANAAVRQEHDPRPLEYRILLPDGSQRAVWAEGRLVHDESGQPSALVGYVQDVTAARRAENALRESQTQLSHIVNTVPEGVLLLAPDGAIRLANPVAQQHLAILAPDHRNRPLQRLGDRLLVELFTSPPQGLWHEILLPDHIFEALAKPVEIGDANDGWVLVLRDVTQERQIRERAQQQERLAAIGQIAAGIAHDFNNILAVFTLYSQLLAHDVAIPPAAQEKLATMQQQAQRASHLIQQILDFSRQSLVERRPLDLLPFTKEILRLLKRTLPENIQIILSHDQSYYMTLADPTRLQQVIMNLAVNARDAMPQGGSLKIHLTTLITTTRNAPIPGMRPAAWLQIQFADTGAGIPRQILPQIFQPFFSTKPAGKGTGLGLAQVYGIIQQHDGYIDVSSTPGAGSIFTLYLPALETNAEDNLTDAVESLRPGHGQHILLVEDEPSARAAMADALTFLNYHVVTAEDGQQALDIIRSQTTAFAAIITDVVMPNMGGVALYHAVRRPHPTIPIILISGHPLDTNIDQGIDGGIAALLPKPVSLVDLSKLLADLFSPDP